MPKHCLGVFSLEAGRLPLPNWTIRAEVCLFGGIAECVVFSALHPRSAEKNWQGACTYAHAAPVRRLVSHDAAARCCCPVAAILALALQRLLSSQCRSCGANSSYIWLLGLRWKVLSPLKLKLYRDFDLNGQRSAVDLAHIVDLCVLNYSYIVCWVSQFNRKTAKDPIKNAHFRVIQGSGVQGVLVFRGFWCSGGSGVQGVLVFRGLGPDVA
uniref:Uncharacterized protein n=1 Tax=Knipowitschia caucasica TaxID=637954 RepID=A0AAV2LFQ6_KNICA